MVSSQFPKSVALPVQPARMHSPDLQHAQLKAVPALQASRFTVTMRVVVLTAVQETFRQVERVEQAMQLLPPLPPPACCNKARWLKPPAASPGRTTARTTTARCSCDSCDGMVSWGERKQERKLTRSGWAENRSVQNVFSGCFFFVLGDVYCQRTRVLVITPSGDSLPAASLPTTQY